MHVIGCSGHRTVATAVFIFLVTACHSAMALPSDAVHITEPRNAAAGFAIILWMSNVDARGMLCSALESASDKTFTTALASWQKRNSPYVNAALSYVADIEDYMLARQGEEARQKFHDDRKAEIVKATHTTEVV